MDENCSVCVNYHEVCPTCKKNGVKIKGCVEDKKQHWHDNGGYVRDPDDKQFTYCQPVEMEKLEEIPDAICI